MYWTKLCKLPFHSHYNSSSSQHSTKYYFIREYCHFTTSSSEKNIQDTRLNQKNIEYSNTKHHHIHTYIHAYIQQIALQIHRQTDTHIYTHSYNTLVHAE